MKLRLSKLTTFCIMIGIFITTSFHISTPAYGNNPPLIEIYCLEDEFPKIIEFFRTINGKYPKEIPDYHMKP